MLLVLVTRDIRWFVKEPMRFGNEPSENGRYGNGAEQS